MFPKANAQRTSYRLKISQMGSIAKLRGFQDTQRKWQKLDVLLGLKMVFLGLAMKSKNCLDKLLFGCEIIPHW